MIKQGVLFYCNGCKPIVELLLALHSFFKHNKETHVHLILGPDAPDWFVIRISQYNNPYFSYRQLKELPDKTIGGKVGHWCNKSFSVKQYTPFKITLYYDCDHVFLKSLPKDTFDLIWKYGLCTGMTSGKPLNITTFFCWAYYANAFFRRNMFTPDSYAVYSRVNGGCVGYARNKRGHRLIERWHNLVQKIIASKDHRIFQVGDESGLSITLNIERIGWLGDKYSTNYHPYSEHPQTLADDLIALHFSRESYKADDIRKKVFLQAAKEARAENFLHFNQDYQKYIECSASTKAVLAI